MPDEMQSGKILIVDDDGQMQKLLTRYWSQKIREC